VLLVTDHTILFRHGCHLKPMDWSTLEDEIPKQKNRNTIHQLDGMINNLKKVIRTSKSSTYVLVFFFYLFNKIFH
jgi:hypothetical protein